MANLPPQVLFKVEGLENVKFNCYRERGQHDDKQPRRIRETPTIGSRNPPQLPSRGTGRGDPRATSFFTRQATCPSPWPARYGKEPDRKFINPIGYRF